MRDDQHTQPDDIAQLLYKAHLRRSADVGPWLKQYLASRRQTVRTKTRLHLADRMMALIGPKPRRTV